MASALFDIGGVAATVLLVAPFAILATVMVLALTKRTPRKPSMSNRTTSERPVSDRKPESATVIRALSGGIDAAPALDAPVLPVSERIAAAEAKGAGVELPALYLESGRQAFAAGQATEGLAHLQKAVLLAARAGDGQTHAEARLDLAEHARAAGDLTTACEHWQIARRLFIDQARKDRVAEADALMRRHGCPTDWVLTDF